MTATHPVLTNALHSHAQLLCDDERQIAARRWRGTSAEEFLAVWSLPPMAELWRNWSVAPVAARGPESLAKAARVFQSGHAFCSYERAVRSIASPRPEWLEMLEPSGASPTRTVSDAPKAHARDRRLDEDCSPLALRANLELLAAIETLLTTPRIGWEVTLERRVLTARGWAPVALLRNGPGGSSSLGRHGLLLWRDLPTGLPLAWHVRRADAEFLTTRRDALGWAPLPASSVERRPHRRGSVPPLHPSSGHRLCRRDSRPAVAALVSLALVWETARGFLRARERAAVAA